MESNNHCLYCLFWKEPPKNKVSAFSACFMKRHGENQPQNIRTHQFSSCEKFTERYKSK